MKIEKGHLPSVFFLHSFIFSRIYRSHYLILFSLFHPFKLSFFVPLYNVHKQMQASCRRFFCLLSGRSLPVLNTKNCLSAAFVHETFAVCSASASSLFRVISSSKFDEFKVTKLPRSIQGQSRAEDNFSFSFDLCVRIA
jgi:hypothetical protein